ncbi:modular serine protease [Carabus blaptoides fortunei]
MFVSQYVCLTTFTLLYLVSYLNTECYGFHILDHADPNFTSRIRRENCGFRCANGECIARHQKCDGKSDCSDNSDESSEICGGTPSVTSPPLPAGSCALPPQPANGAYTVNISSTIHLLTYSCSPGYQIYPSSNNAVAICDSGKWHTSFSECLQTCSPRISESVDTDCEHEGIKVDCSKPMLEGTTVRMNCKHFYSQVDSSANRVSVCRDGSWDYSFIKCTPECGNSVPQATTFILGGEIIKKITYPWHVGIYKLNATNQYDQVCGGSIISRKMILSAAHCFTAYMNGAPHDVKQYAIAAGKYYRHYYDERDTLSQTRTVKQVIIPEKYKGLLMSFTADIAFVILDKAFELTLVVQPVCIDWYNKYEAAQLTENNIGTVVGWGYTVEGKSPSAELKQLSVPFVNRETCLNAVPENFVRFVARDKFCAGFRNGSSVCQGDGGGGLAFLLPDNNKYYLRGLVSVGPTKDGQCDPEQYVAYTKVSDYMDMLQATELTTKV